MVGLGISLPVQVGPVDLGKVNVVAGVKLRSDYGIDITADVPTSIKGIPMYLRQLTVNVNKAGFLFNPSTCATRSAGLTMTSASYAGASSSANASSSLTFTQCANLGFSPTVGFSATRRRRPVRRQLRHHHHAAEQPGAGRAQARRRAAAGCVSLSPSIDSAGNLTGCTDAQFDVNTPFTDPTCPTASKIGDLTIGTGSVGPLTGGVYLARDRPGPPRAAVRLRTQHELPGCGRQARRHGRRERRHRHRDRGLLRCAGGAVHLVHDELPRWDEPRTVVAAHLRHAERERRPDLVRQRHTPVTSTGTLTINANCASGFAATATVASSPTAAAASTSLTTTISVPPRARN